MIDLWQEIYSTIKRNKLRTFLTGFSVAWGIFILIVLLGAGNGLIHAMEKNMEGTTLNIMRIFPGTTSKAYQGLKEGRDIDLHNSDVEHLQKNFSKNILQSGASVSKSGVTIAQGTEYTKVTLNGVYPLFLKVQRLNIIKGRFIDETDMGDNKKSIILNYKTAKILFDKAEPLGQYIKANDMMYKVVGIYKDQDNEESNRAYIPFSTLQLLYNKGDTISNISFSTKGLETKAQGNKFEKDYRKMMGANHHFDPLDDSAIWIWNRMEDYLQQQQADSILKTAIWIIGIFTLLSGIVGVSNIMLITVRERTREFGIRKALGAKPSSILKLIIVESIMITAIFGYIGMIIGIAVTEYMNSAIGNQLLNVGTASEVVFLNPTVDISIAIEATIALIIAGTLAGFFPARKATKIRPIEALRAE